MLIGELSKQTWLSKDTIRFYEKLGLITASSNDIGTKSYKRYSSETIERLSTIVQGKGLGFTLSEIKQLLDEWGEGEISKRDLIEIIERKIEEVVKKKQQLESIETYLVNKLSKLNQQLSIDSEMMLVTSKIMSNYGIVDRNITNRRRLYGCCPSRMVRLGIRSPWFFTVWL